MAPSPCTQGEGWGEGIRLTPSGSNLESTLSPALSLGTGRGRPVAARGMMIRSMRRRVFDLLCYASVLTFVVLTVLAVRGLFVLDKYYVVAGRNRLIVGSFPVHLHVIGYRFWSMPFQITHTAGPPIPVAPRYWELRWGALPNTANGWFVAVPHWLLLLMSSALPLYWLLVLKRTRKRRRMGLCIACGYDLRASTGRCPECGTPVAPTTEAGATPTPSPSGRGLG